MEEKEEKRKKMGFGFGGIRELSEGMRGEEYLYSSQG